MPTEIQQAMHHPVSKSLQFIIRWPWSRPVSLLLRALMDMAPLLFHHRRVDPLSQSPVSQLVDKTPLVVTNALQKAKIP